MIYSYNDIVISGFSAVTAAGNGIEAVLELLGSGRDALSSVPDEIAANGGQRWGKALGFRASDFMPPLKARKLDRCSQFAVGASGLALKDAGIDPKNINAERIGIALGCGFGGVANSAEFLSGYFKGGVEGLAPVLFPNTVSNAPASNSSIEHGLKGPNVTLVQRFCSAESAFAMACRFITEGRADVMLTGGADDLMPLMITGFAATGQLRRYAACFGEGSGILVLESAAHAARRNAPIKATVEAVASVGLLPAGHEQEGADRLFTGAEQCDLISLSGTAGDTPLLMQRIEAHATFDISSILGRSLAMGGTAIATLLASLKPGQQGLHLAASPEGPYYAIRFTGGTGAASTSHCDMKGVSY
ncbi:beta-ketoacyl synthase N-terminal-like domain-containing protein [Geobacter sp. AOG2]|uniref:beta-ketoacyl synthase N-terminal-like domain-containing protein n=1 Tax=Geobacter sp. AOG2 TaxID=1566347 RepID=UPI001CC45002|nr:beta-ketoacyl synthase N-terminal-like domain-containing protein [Geobacter sp. AOG2]GFE61045.1 beta-ketoacyl synthase [Geobacter sp. AOG2]